MKSLWTELRRRKVVRVAVIYLLGAWVMLQVGDTVLGLGDFPSWIGQALLAVIVLGLPIALILSWIFDITPEGLVTTGSVEESPRDEFVYADPEPLDVGQLQLGQLHLTPLIGRAEECSLIEQCLEEIADTHGGILLIGGEPGVGKTRLGEEAIQQAGQRGLLPLVGHAYEERGTPFITSTEILEEVTRVLPRTALKNVLGGTAPEITRLLPELRRVFPGIPEPLELPPEQQQRYLVNAVLEFLTRLTRSCPIVLLLDDMHWADESSILLLEHIAPHLPQLPILMVITYRDVDSDMGKPFQRALAKLSRLPFVRRMPLQRLGREDVAMLLATVGPPNPPAALVDIVFEETGGNAFFAQSVIRHLADECRLFDAHGNWLTHMDADSLAVPESVRLVTGGRIAKLSQETQDILAIAAAAGLRFPLGILEATADHDRVVDAIEEAEAAQLVKQSVGGRELRYEFVHALARQTLLDSMSAPRQQRLHLKVADAIKTRHSARLEYHAAQLAFHLVKAGSLVSDDEVVHWLHTSGSNAMAAAAFEEAVHYFSTALTIVGELDAEKRAELLHARGAAQLSLGRKSKFLEDLQRAFATYEELRLGEKGARVAADMAYILVWDAQPGEIFALISRALDLLGDENSAGRGQLLSAQGLAYTIGRQPGPAEQSHDAAVALARNLKDPVLLADVLQNQALANWQRLAGQSQEMPAHEAGVLRRQSKQEWNLGHCLWMEKAGLVFQGRFDEAEQLDPEIQEIAGRNEDYGTLGCSALMSGTIAQARGDVESSAREFRKSIEYFEAGKFPWGVFSEGHLSVNELLLGRQDEARRAFEVAGAQRIPGISWTGCDSCYWLSGKAALGDPEIFESYVSLRPDLPVAGKPMASGAVQLLEGCIEALVLAGHDEDAAKLYPAIRDRINSGLGSVAFTYGLHERFAGMAAAAAREWQQAAKHYESALALAENLPHRVDQARIRYWFARMLLKRNLAGDRERALGMLQQARELSESMGLPGLMADIDSAAQ
jgi:tetratricopeptide (TPR) repeat protein